MKLTIDHISKQFSDHTAVNNVSLDLTPGIWGLLGANGAGKTTLIRMLTDITTPSSGQILYDGVPITTLKESYRDILGYLPQEFGFYPSFTVNDYLEYMAALKGLPTDATKKKITELLERLALMDVRRKKIAKLSGGMRRRVGIAQALLNDPEVLILDEPTSGLDPSERIRLRNLLTEFAQNRIVLISTHIVSDVENIANQIAIMKEGALLTTGNTQQLVQTVAGKVWKMVIPAENLIQYEQKLQIVNLHNETNGNIAIRYLSNHPLSDDSVMVSPGMEDLFLWLFPQSVKGEEQHA
jgi:ABC-2 type transport system ATP-binding protein